MILVGWQYSKDLFPPPKPVTAENVRTEMRNGRWRITFDLTISIACPNIIYRREWLDDELGSLPAIPVASILGDRAVSEVFTGRLKPGTYPDRWAEFEPIQGSKGIYRLLIHPGGGTDPSCLDGGVLISEPYDFTAFANANPK